MSVSDINKRLHYFSFLAVRHPFDRIVSAYYDKFIKNPSDYYRKYIGVQIHKKFNPRASDFELKTGQGVRFDEFVDYMNVYKDSDHHWASIQSVCFPCENKFNYVINLEASAADQNYIINQRLSGRTSNDSAVKNIVSGGARLKRLLPEYRNVSTKSMKLLEYHYRTDLEMFGYTIQRSTSGSLVTMCSSKTKTGKICC